MNSSDLNLKEIVNYLKREGVKLDFQDFEFQLNAHPDFPSLLAYSDTLTFFNVDNFASKVAPEQIEHLPDQFIAIMEEEKSSQFLFLIKRVEDKFIHRNKRLSQPEFLKKWKNIIFFVDNETSFAVEESKKSKIFNHLTLAALSLVLLVGTLFYYQASPIVYLMLLTSMGGLFLATEAFKSFLGMGSSLTQKFCNLGVKTDCEAVIQGNKWAIFKKINLSDISVVFFGAQFISLIGLSVLGLSNSFLSLLQIGFIAAVPLCLTSIFYQWRIIKQWCPLCLGIITLLFFQLGITFFVTSLDLNAIALPAILFFAISVLLMSTLIAYLKPLLQKNADLKEARINDLRIIQNYGTFKQQLLSKPSIINNTADQALLIGHPDAKLKISLATNPHCGFCKAAHSLMEKILSNYGNDVAFLLRFNFFGAHKSDNSRRLHHQLLRIYFEEGQEKFVHALHTWFEHKDFDLWLKKHEQDITIQDKIHQTATGHSQWCQQNDIVFSPGVIIAGHIYPQSYDLEYLPMFIEELIQDDSIEHVPVKNEQLAV